MIKTDDTLIESFVISDIYKDDYIKIFTIYDQDFEYFSKTISSITKRLNKYRIDDNNLSKFLGFYWKFIKTCNSFPITVAECVTLTEVNTNINVKKIKDILCTAYPDYQKEFDYVVKKFDEFKTTYKNLYSNQNLDLMGNSDNILLYDGNYPIDRNNKFIKKINFFLQPNFKKINSISLFNPQLELLQEISFLDVCDFVKVYNFGWINKNYENLNLLVSNSNFTTNPLNIKYIESIKPAYTVKNELIGEIFEEDLSLSSDLVGIFEKLNAQNLDEKNIEDTDLKNENDLDKVKSTLFQLSNGKIALLRNDRSFDQSQDVLEKSPLDKISVKSKKVDLIQPGEFVLFQGERATTMLEKETSIFESEAHIMYSNRRDWKFRLRQEINRLGLDKVIDKLKEYSGSKSIKLHNITYWLNPKSLKSDDKNKFFAIMKLCGLYNKSEEIWQSMEKLEKAHRKAGKIIRKKIEQVIAKDANQLQEKGYQEYFLDDEGSGSVEVYKIIEKGKSLKVKLSITDRPLSPGEL